MWCIFSKKNTFQVQRFYYSWSFIDNQKNLQQRLKQIHNNGIRLNTLEEEIAKQRLFFVKKGFIEDLQGCTIQLIFFKNIYIGSRKKGRSGLKKEARYIIKTSWKWFVTEEQRLPKANMFHHFNNGRKI